MSQASRYSARPFDGSLTDLDIEHTPHPVRVMGFVRLEVWRARVQQPYGALLAQSKRHAVGREREDPVRRLDVVWVEPAGIAVDGDEGGHYLRRLEIAEHFAQQGAAEGRGFVEFAWLHRHSALRQRQQRGAV